MPGTAATTSVHSQITTMQMSGCRSFVRSFIREKLYLISHPDNYNYSHETNNNNNIKVFHSN